MTCKNCIHYQDCKNYTDTLEGNEVEKLCFYFKDKSKIIELPCKVGEDVYIIKYCRCARPQNAERQICHHKEISSTPKCYAKLMVKQYNQHRIWDKFFLEYHYENVAVCTICYKVHKKPFKLEYLTEIGKTVFLTKEEAEQKLKELENGNDK